MHQIRLVGFLIIGTLLAGCGALEKIEYKAAFSVGAVPLTIDEDLKKQWDTFKVGIADVGPNSTTTTKKDYLGFIASTSEASCAKFLANLVVASNGTNTGLDMITTVFSALGTAFTPLATVHALTAGASISSGWKTAIDSDIYAKLTVYSLVQAIQSTYYKDIGKYVDALANKKESDISLTAEITKIQTIHGECTLASAEGSIQSSLKTSGQSPATTSSATLTIKTGAGAVGDTLDLTPKSTSTPGLTAIHVGVTPQETSSDIAKAVADAVNKANMTGISAKVSSDDPITITLSWPTSDDLTWVPMMKHGKNSGVTFVYTPLAATPDTQAGQPGQGVAK